MAGLGDLLNQAGIGGFDGWAILSYVIGFVVLILVILICGILGFWAYNRLTYRIKIVIFEKIGQSFEPTRKDRAKEIVIGDGGERVLYLKKHKIWKVADKQASRGTYWFAVVNDGYWYNITLGDLNSNLGTFQATGINPEMHKIMRYQTAALRKNLDERHRHKKWWEHGFVPWLAAMLFIIIAGLMYYFMFKQGFQVMPQILQQLNIVLERMNNLQQCVPMSGLKPA